MKRILLVSITVLIITCLCSVGVLANSTMTWHFEIFGNPNARQVALNIANAQKELSRTAEEQSGLDQFKESINRMAMSKAVRDIVYYDPESDDPNSGFVPVDDGWIYYQWDEVDKRMKIYYYSNGSWTEISIDSGQPEAPK
ncbi:MAG: hypothetical protein GX971_04245 [Firmicutes bacterium]|nr:hypothetical protein [Bacillota bacterium]